jgi:restriction system protein
MNATDPLTIILRALAPSIAFLIFGLALASVFAVFMRWLKSQGKGMIGEMVVNSRLRQLPTDVYHLIPDLMLPIDGGTTQIDHVVVSRYGIFVVETKAYQGWIFGSERDAQWTQTIYRKKSRFQNPLRQNYRHTATLAQLTGIPRELFISLVAFSGEAEFKTPMPPTVVKIAQLADTIRSYSQPLIQDEQVPDVVEAIKAWAATVDTTTRRNHVQNLKKRHSSG